VCPEGVSSERPEFPEKERSEFTEPAPADEGDVLEGRSYLGRVLCTTCPSTNTSPRPTTNLWRLILRSKGESLVEYLDLAELHRRRAELTFRLADGRVLDFSMGNENGTIRSTGRGLFTP
jgi:hypothetical protein